MISPDVRTLEKPKHDFGADAKKYAVYIQEEEDLHKIFLAVFGLIVIGFSFAGLIFSQPLFLPVSVALMVICYAVSGVYVSSRKRFFTREYNADLQRWYSGWIKYELIPYLRDEHGITVLESDYLKLINPSGEGLKAQTLNGEVIRFKLDGVNFEYNGFFNVVSVAPGGLAVMITQRGFSV